jgi:hypothetical protein
MADFDPDAYLAKKRAEREASAKAEADFDPDLYLLNKEARRQQEARAAGQPVGPGAKALPRDVTFAEGVARGAAQGATLGFADEITGAVESAFGPKTYTQARNESREKYARAEKGQKGGYMLGEIGGGVASGLATGGAAAVLGKGAQLGLRGATALAAAEGGLAGLGASEAEDLRGMATDAGTGALVGGAVGAIGGKLTRRYIDSAKERHAKHLASAVTEGTNKTNKKRFAQIQELAPEVFDTDKPLRKALDDPEKATELVQERLKLYGNQTKPLYEAMDKRVPRMKVADVTRQLDDEIAQAAQEPGKTYWMNTLKKARDDFESATMYAARVSNPAADPATVEVPTLKVRKWVSNLLSEADSTMGGLAETERWALKDRLHGVADDILKSHIRAGAATDEATQALARKLTDINKKLAVLVKTEDALKPRVTNELVGQKSLTQTLKGLGVPGLVGIMGAGGDVITGGAYAAGASALIKGGKALNKATTTALAKLASKADAGSATAQDVIAALKVGIPLGAVRATLSARGSLPSQFEWMEEPKPSR